jgi:hypothetical protein
MTIVGYANAFVGQEKLTFPTTCPSCDHSPLEADSCTPNKTLRNTQRVWLQKQKKKEEKAATQAPATPVEATPAAPEVQPVGDAADKPVESIEEASKAEGASDNQVAAENSGDADERAGSAAVQPNEVGLYLSDPSSLSRRHALSKQDREQGASSLCLAKMNMIVAARASDRGVPHLSCAVTNHDQDTTATQNDDTERRGSIASQSVAQSAEPSAADAPAEQNASGANNAMMGNNPMMMNGMSGQMGYGFNNGMGFGMNGMSNMMGNGNWNGMNPMGMLPYTLHHEPATDC